MPRILSRTTDAFITYSVECEDGARHKVRFSLDGELIHYEHDADGEEVIRALGGALPACATARTIFAVAQSFLPIYAGQQDCEGLVSLGNDDWKDKSNECGSCSSRPAGLAHFNSLKHYAGKAGVADNTRQISTTIKWLAQRNDLSHGRIETLRDLEFALDRNIEGNQSSWVDDWIHNRYVTTGFLTAVAKSTMTDQLDDIMFMRANFTTQWLESFWSALTRKAQNKIINEFALWKRIAKARNKDAQLVAAFVNAGIYSNVYTYINNHVTPEQAREIYDGYRGERSAKSFIDADVPVARALRELRTA